MKIFLRTSLKNAGYSLINISGLAVGMTTFILISLYVWNERSYDDFHVKKDRIFRVRHDRYTNGELTRQWVAGPAGIGPDLKANFSEVRAFVRLLKEDATLSTGDTFFKEDRAFYASKDFFKIFSYRLLRGKASEVLNGPFKMVISESLAKRYFGDKDPIGKSLVNKGKYEYEITGIVEDVPENSHLKFDILLSFSSYIEIIGPEEAKDFNSWKWDGYYTYVELERGVKAEAFEDKLPSFVERQMGKELHELNEGMSFRLQPLSSIHLYSNFADEIEPNGNERSVNFLSVIAAFILIMAWINYINLSTAKSLERAREVGLRKLLGSRRGQLISQFLLESFTLNFIALILTTFLVLLLLPHFSTLVNRRLDPFPVLSAETCFFIACVFLLGVIGSAAYPALALSGFEPATILKGKLKNASKGGNLRRALVAFQFLSSIILIIGTVAIYQQIQFLRNSPLGIDIEEVLVINGPYVSESTYASKFKSFKDDLVKSPDITAVTASSTVPGRSGFSRGGIHLTTQGDQHGKAYRVIVTDDGFKDVFGLQLVAGRYFSPAFNDTNSLVVNETAMRSLGFTRPEQAIGASINSGETIIGVVNDYHHESLKKRVDPLVFVYDKAWSDYYSVKIKTKKPLPEVINTMEARYKAAFPGNPFDYFFLDDYYNRQYASDERFGNIVGLFMILGIIIACLGLFGLSSYVVLQRTKEIAIRKVLGSTIQQIVILVSSEFVLTILVANIIGWPIAYYLVKIWLSGFAYRIDLGFLSFLIPGMCTLLIGIFTVATQSIKAANANQVRNLRSE